MRKIREGDLAQAWRPDHNRKEQCVVWSIRWDGREIVYQVRFQDGKTASYRFEELEERNR